MLQLALLCIVALTIDGGHKITRTTVAAKLFGGHRLRLLHLAAIASYNCPCQTPSFPHDSDTQTPLPKTPRALVLARSGPSVNTPLVDSSCRSVKHIRRSLRHLRSGSGCTGQFWLCSEHTAGGGMGQDLQGVGWNCVKYQMSSGGSRSGWRPEA